MIPSDPQRQRNIVDPSLSGKVGAMAADSLEPIAALDPAMAALMRRVEDVAMTNATVLIVGESGSGKELIAAHLHRTSNRRDKAFVTVNCAGAPDVALESELFGHEPGAFFGATARRTGRFEAASGGTLLLDEIGEMDPRIQAKLLRAIEQREVDRVGAERPVPVDVRIVATTNKDLHKEVRLGHFRADLLFRLNVITLKVPPLRERTADLRALANFFLQKFARANGRRATSLAPSALELLLLHDWPGNVRELENVMHRAVLTETGQEVTADALTIVSGGDIDTSDEKPPTPAIDVVAPSTTAGRTIEAVEKDMILETLCQRMGNRAQTAAVLGISIRTLRNKLNEYERDGTRIPRPVVSGLA